MNEKEKWMEERELRMTKAIRREEVDKTPFMSISDQYTPFYFGVDKGTITSYEIAADLHTRFDIDLRCDTSIIPFEAVNLTVTPKYKLLGGGTFIVKDNTKMQSPDKVDIMNDSEYPELIESPAKFLINKVYKRRYELLNKSLDEQYNGYLQVLDESHKNLQYISLLEQKGSHITQSGVLINPVDIIFGFLREFKGIINDIKRRPELVRDAGLAIAEELKSLIDTMPPTPDKGIFIPMWIPAFLRPKEFEKVYWPSFKLLAEYMVEHGHNVFYYFEKNYGHLQDYLQELPKNGIVGIFQEDDLIKTKKKLGNTMAIAGGLSTAIMQHNTKEQCIDHVKKLIDDLAPGGGYFIAPDTPMMFPSDARPENLKAIADYIFNSKK
ncbi:MAG: uroporphyrinogen decarboxylase family protein [Eubacteriales bacterium]